MGSGFDGFTVCQVNITDDRSRPLASRAFIAERFSDRLRGLLGRPELPEGHAMIFPKCNSIHTMGMRFPIDAAFVDRDWRVVSVHTRISPGQVIWPVAGAWGVIELAGGALGKAGLRVGDQLCQVSDTSGEGLTR